MAKIASFFKKIWAAWVYYGEHREEIEAEYEVQKERDCEALRRWDYECRIKDINSDIQYAERRKQQLKRDFGY